MARARDSIDNNTRLKRNLVAFISACAALLLIAVGGQIKMNEAINLEMLSVVANGRKETLQQYFQGNAAPIAANSYATSPYADNDLAAADGNGVDYSQFDNYGPSPASLSVAPRQAQGSIAARQTQAAGLNGFLSDDAGDEIIGIPRGSSTAYNIGPNNFPFASTAALQAAQSNIIAQQEALTKYTYAVQSAIATNNAIVKSIQAKLASLVVGKSSTIAMMQAMINRLTAQNALLQKKIAKVVAFGRPINGKDGKPGHDGRVGPQGPRGLTGKPGLNGARGPPGPKGVPGLRGLPGRPGVKGAQGPQGAAGHNGKNGLNGPPGTNGKNGKNGKDGRPGQPGPPGRPGTSAKPSAHAQKAKRKCRPDFFLSKSRGCLRFRLPQSGSLQSGEKLYSRNEKYTFVVQNDCNLVKKRASSVAGAIGVTIKKGEKGYGQCHLIWGGSGRGFMFAKGRPRALWKSQSVGKYLWAMNDGRLVSVNSRGVVTGVIIK